MIRHRAARNRSARATGVTRGWGMPKRLPRRPRRARFRNGTVRHPPREGAGMASLTIKNIPEALLNTLRRQAKENNRSLNQEVITCLQLGALRPKRDPEVIIRRLRAFRERLRATGVEPMSTEEIVAMIRRGRGGHSRAAWTPTGLWRGAGSGAGAAARAPGACAGRPGGAVDSWGR